MKEYYIQNGPNKGIHYMFESSTEAFKWLNSEELCYLNINKQVFNSELSFDSWWAGNKGDWVKTDDGYIVQILNRWDCIKTYSKRIKGERKVRLITRKFSTGIPIMTSMYRFCFGAYTRWNTAKGEWRHKRVAAHPTTFEEIRKNRGSIGRGNELDTPLGKGMTMRKLLFCFYVAQTGDPMIAYDKLCVQFPKLRNERKITNNLHISLVVSLMQDPLVITEIKKHIINMDEFKANLKKALTDNGLDTDKAMEVMKRVIDNPKTPAIAALKAVEMITNMNRYVEDTSNQLNPDGSKVGGSRIPENAKFEEIEEGKQNNALPELPELPSDRSNINFKQRMNEEMGEFSVDAILPE